MLKRTFKILTGVGARLERHLWREGILTWEDFLTIGYISGISKDRKYTFDREIAKALYALDKGDIDYFTFRLPHTEYWRLFNAFRKDAVCLDIETMGGQAAEGEVTLIGMYGSGEMYTLIKDVNLDSRALSDILSQYKLIITYYGCTFDIPFLHKAIPGININMPNYDLCFASHRLGIKGGLKKLEACFGIRRSDLIAGMNGYDAVKLWRRYMAGNKRALELLIQYNEADTKNLYLLAEILYNRLCKEFGPEIGKFEPQVTSFTSFP